MKKLGDLLNGIEYCGTPDKDAGINIVVMDSRKVKEGALFVCVKGKNFDGHDVAADALKNGARAVVTERPLGLENEITVKDTRAAYAHLCQNYFDNPHHQLTLVAVTGTNGKTTVSSITKQALCNLGYKTGLIGTIRSEIGDIYVPAKFTTPEAWDISALLSRMVSAGCTHVVMEASSQALAQGRLIGLEFACSVFTNLTPDHLDYHGTMEDYYEAKKSLFRQSQAAVVNIDDPWGQRLVSEIGIPCTTVSSEDDAADYTAQNADYAISGVRFDLVGGGYTGSIRVPMPGLYSVSNALCAACALFALGFDRDSVCKAVSATQGVKGRCEILYDGECTVIGDFAHTADGLEQLLSSLRPFVTGGRMLAVFGCAGDRDPAKRPAMAQAVCRYADVIVMSGDNPRTEDPCDTIEQVRPILQASGKPYQAIPDRYEAIRWAAAQLEPGDVLVLCGKGHEDYQVLNGCTIYLNEGQIVREILTDN